MYKLYLVVTAGIMIKEMTRNGIFYNDQIKAIEKFCDEHNLIYIFNKDEWRYELYKEA